MTGERVLILDEANSRNLQALSLRSLDQVAKSVHRDGSGTLRFGARSLPFSDYYVNSGMDLFGIYRRLPGFYDIDDVQAVYELINQQRGREA